MSHFRLIVATGAVTALALVAVIVVLVYAVLLGVTDPSALAGYGVGTALAVCLPAPAVIRVALRGAR